MNPAKTIAQANLLLVLGWLLAGSCAAAEKPNIVLLFIDDWAWNGTPVPMHDGDTSNNPGNTLPDNTYVILVSDIRREPFGHPTFC